MWYEDGRVFLWKDGEPWESPVFGLEVIAQRTQEYPEIIASGDPFVIYRTDWGCWQECDHAGYWDMMLNNAQHVVAVRWGRMIKKSHFHALYQEARAWLDG